MKRKLINKNIAIVSMFILTMPIAYSSFYIDNALNGVKNNLQPENPEEQIVAYVDNANTLFTSIEAALAYAENDSNSNYIYVIPNTNPTIKDDCRVASGDHLIIPYSYTNINVAPSGTDASSVVSLSDIDPTTEGTPACRLGTSADFADATETLVNTNRKNSIHIEDGVTLEIASNAELLISGITGHTGVALSAQTSGSYTELVLGESTKIVNNGTIKCAGYIKTKSLNNNSLVIMKSNSKAYMPFVVYDYEGGASTVVAYCTSNISPFLGYNMPNIQSKITCNYRSTIYGLVDLYTGGGMGTDPQHNLSSVPIIGYKDSSEEALFELDSQNSYLDIIYNNNNEKYTINDWSSGTSPTTELNFYGDCSINSMTISVKAIGSSPVNISTYGLYFPISYLHKISVSSGTLKINSQLKFLTGTSLTVNNDANLLINANTIFYSSFQDNYGLTSVRYPNNLESSYLLNLGKVYVADNQGLAGYVYTDVSLENKLIEFSNNASLALDSVEGGSGQLKVTGINGDSIGILLDAGLSLDEGRALIDFVVFNGEFDDRVKNGVGKLGTYEKSETAGTQTISETAKGYISSYSATSNFSNNTRYVSEAQNNYWNAGTFLKKISLTISGMEDGGIFGIGKDTLSFEVYGINSLTNIEEKLFSHNLSGNSGNGTYEFNFLDIYKQIKFVKTDSDGSMSLGNFDWDQYFQINESETKQLSINFS